MATTHAIPTAAGNGSSTDDLHRIDGGVTSGWSRSRRSYRQAPVVHGLHGLRKRELRSDGYEGIDCVLACGVRNGYRSDEFTGRARRRSEFGNSSTRSAAGKRLCGAAAASAKQRWQLLSRWRGCRVGNFRRTGTTRPIRFATYQGGRPRCIPDPRRIRGRVWHWVRR